MTRIKKYRQILHSTIEGILYYTRSKHAKGHGIHSPFVYDFVRKVLVQKKTKKHQKTQVKNLRKKLTKKTDIINLANHGAGSRIQNEHKSFPIGKLIKQSGLTTKYITLLIDTIQHYKYNNFLELGTCCGLTTTAVAIANPKLDIVTIENAHERASWAQKEFKRRELNNINLIEMDFTSAINRLNKNNKRFDMVFIDGDHTYEGTMKYFKLLKPMMNENGVLIFDDIYWSKEMTQAWKEICNTQSCGITIDMYRMGMLFIRPNQHIEHFIIRF